MIVCRSCQAQNVLNAVFCEECGQNLLEQQDNSSSPRADERKNRSQRPWPKLIRLIMLNSGRAIDLSFGHEAVIGRRDTPQGSAPDIDLSPEGGFEAGVSRRHAQISYQEGQALVQDLASTNGTSLNQKPLTPYLAQSLQHGDEIKLGSLVLRVEFR